MSRDPHPPAVAAPSPPRLLCFADGPWPGGLAALVDQGRLVLAGSAPCAALAHSPEAASASHALFVGHAAALCEATAAWVAAPDAPLTWLGPPPTAANLAVLTARGLSGWWPTHLADEELLAALALDQARWARERAAARALAEVQGRLDDRQWLDRAKGVLGQTRGLAEAEAHVLLRNLAMHAGQRLGDVSRALAEAATWADALNRAGQLRMLSQRLVKLAAQRLLEVDAARARHLEAEAVARGHALLADLAALPRRTPTAADGLHDRLAAVSAAWAPLAGAAGGRPTAAALLRAEALADQLLADAEALVKALEAAANRRPLHAVNLCGRQRMLAQRLAKSALLAGLPDGAAHGDAIAPAIAAFEAALHELDATPLSTGEIREALGAARDAWQQLLAGVQTCRTAEGRLALSRASDALLDHFDRLTGLYERSLQVLMS